MLVPTIVILMNSARPRISVYRKHFFVLPIVGPMCPDLGTLARMLTMPQCSLCWDSVSCANTWIYFAGDPESGGQPIGPRSTALEEGFRLRFRSWASAK